MRHPAVPCPLLFPSFARAMLLVCALAPACGGGPEGTASGSGGRSGSSGTTGAGGTTSVGGTTGGAGTSGSAGSSGVAGTGASAGTSGGVGGTSAAGTSGGVGGSSGPGAAGRGGTGGRGGGVGTAGMSGAGTGGLAGTGGGKAGSGATGGGAGMGVAGTGGGTTGSCSTPPAASPLVGWAAVAGSGTTTTTGGGSASPQTVTSVSALTAAAAGDTPAVLYVKGVLAPGKIDVGSNKTIVGLCGAEIHGHLELNGASNIIIRNVKIVGYGVGDCSRDPDYDASVGCSSGNDAITVSHDAHHIWFDHCDISDGTDGNLDITRGADFVTISWTKFHYTPRTDPSGNDSTGASGHRFSNLIGSSDDVPGDVGHLNVTWHHDWWADNVMERMPRTRYGKIHLFNNLFTSTGNNYCTNAGHEASLLVESNVYVGVKNPLKPDSDGDMKATSNIFTNTSGTATASGTGFSPPYTYTPESASAIQAEVTAGAGPH